MAGDDLPQNSLCKHFFDTLRFAMILLLLGALAWFSTTPARQSPPSKPLVRACADSWNDSGSNTKKNRPKSSKNQPAKAAGACVELAFTTLDIQEHLQSYARAQQWKITGDQMTEDSWTFSLELDKEELLRDITEESKSKRVEWTGGTVHVHVNTAQLPDGYARTIIRAYFRGYGRNMDQFAMHQEYWELDSNSNFENSIVAVLRTHFAAVSPQEGHRRGIQEELHSPHWNRAERSGLLAFHSGHISWFCDPRALQSCYFQTTKPAFAASKH